MVNQNGWDLIRGYGLWPSSSSLSSSSFSHSSGSCSSSVSNVAIHWSKPEELTCCPSLLKLWLLRVQLWDRSLPMWWVGLNSWEINFRILWQWQCVPCERFSHESCTKCGDCVECFEKKCFRTATWVLGIVKACGSAELVQGIGGGRVTPCGCCSSWTSIYVSTAECES